MNERFKILKDKLHKLNREINELETEFFLERCSIISANKNDVIIEADKKQHSLYFLSTGLVRSYYIDKKGNEITIRFIDSTGWVTHYSSLLTGSASRYYFQCLDKCELIQIPFDHIQKGYKKYSSLERTGRLIAEKILISQQKRIESFQFYNAEQRYEQFVKEYPALFNKITLSHLSSYLGIKRQSLSRLRKNNTHK